MYGVLLFVIVFILLATLVFTIFWAVEESKMKSTARTVSSREVFSLSGLTSPYDHWLSRGLCIAAPDVPVFLTNDMDVCLIISPECTSGKNRVTARNRSIVIDAKLEGHAPVPYMFYLLTNSSLIFNINIISWKNVKEIKVFLLLKNQAAFEQCIYGHQPSTFTSNKTCQKYMKQPCTFNIQIEKPGHYYICFWMPNGTVVGTYSMKINPFWHYEVAGTKH